MPVHLLHGMWYLPWASTFLQALSCLHDFCHGLQYVVIAVQQQVLSETAFRDGPAIPFLVCKRFLTHVHAQAQVQHQLEAREEIIGIVVNPLLEQEFTTPLLDVQGELRRGYSQRSADL